METLHLVVGVGVLITNLAAGLVGAIAWLRREPSVPFWYLLRVAQAAVVLQVLLGTILLLLGNEAPDDLHYVYGVLPLLVTLLAEAARVGAAERELEGVDFDALPKDRQHRFALAIVRRETGIMAVSALVVFGLALRAAGTSGAPVLTKDGRKFGRRPRLLCRCCGYERRWPNTPANERRRKPRTRGATRTQNPAEIARRELIAWCQAHQLPVPAERDLSPAAGRHRRRRSAGRRRPRRPSSTSPTAISWSPPGCSSRSAQATQAIAPSRIGTPSRSLQPTSRNFSVCGALEAKPRASASWPAASTLTPKRAAGADDVEGPRAAVEAGEHERRVERERRDRVRRRPGRAVGSGRGDDRDRGRRERHHGCGADRVSARPRGRKV